MKPINLAIFSHTTSKKQLELYEALITFTNISLTAYLSGETPPARQARLNSLVVSGRFHYILLKNNKIKNIMHQIKKEHHDLWIISGWFDLTYWIAIFACAFYKKKFVLRGDSHLISSQNKFLLPFKYILFKLIKSKVSGVFAVGKLNSELYQFYGIPNNKIFHIPQFVDSAQYYVNFRKIRNTYEQKHTFTILFCGRFIAEKNIQQLINVFKKIQKNLKKNDIKLILVGDGPLYKTYKRQINCNIFMPGWVPAKKLQSFYLRSDVFVLPSRYETWGYVVNEAMACGLPVIASSHVGCAPDLIQQGKTGYVYALNKPKELEQYISNYIIQPSLAAQHGKNAQERIIREFNAPSITLKMHKAIITLCRGRKNRTVK